MALDLLILGAGGNSREVAEAAQDLGWNVLGFLDDDVKKHGLSIDKIPVLGPIVTLHDYDAKCICTLGTWRRPAIRQIVCDRIGPVNPQRWATIIHPSAQIARSARIGVGCVILSGVTVGAGAIINDHVFILQQASISHDCLVEDYATITSGARLAGGVHLERAAYIGMGSTILNDVVIGAEAVVGLGAVAVKNVPTGATVVGNPAKPIIAS
jgi:sugar O-acyltransferase (sialic acid O-acetyltransferase NeuD family)